MTVRHGEVSVPRAKRRARVRELARVDSQQDLFADGDGQLVAPPHISLERTETPVQPELMLARAEDLRSRAYNHARMQREHARAAAALLAEATRLEEAALQLALPLARGATGSGATGSGATGSGANR